MRAEEHNNKKEWRTRGLSVNNDRAMRERERERETVVIMGIDIRQC